MIIWLASYPRSGNTLLRTVLYQCIGLNSYSMDPVKKIKNNPLKLTNTSHITGALHYKDSNWESFYQRASQSNKIFFVKTHTHPVDEQPVIYVIRDGRSATLSYLDYYQSKFPEANRSLDQIISGDDVYGGWTEHYRAWSRHNGPSLFLRFEELVHGSQETLQRIANFIGHHGSIKPWKNPREELNQLAPWFFRQGETTWKAREPWKNHHDRLFYAMHGELMQEMDFYTQDELQALENDALTNNYEILKGTIESLVSSNKELQNACDERMAVITRLDDRIKCNANPLRMLWRFIFRGSMKCYTYARFLLRRWIGPHVGILEQYRPRPLCLPSHYLYEKQLDHYPTISIVTASLNQAEFIERTIQSVLNQQYPKLEYIIHDGGSDDCTLDILKQYETQLNQWCSQPDKGQTDALNQGFIKTNGEIMAYLNTDDLLLPNALNYVADFFQRHPDVDAVYGHRILIDENDNDIGKWVMPEHDDDVLRWVDYIPQETLFWRRSLWDKVGGQLDDSFNFAMDWDLLLRFMESNAKFVRLPRYLGAFRVHPQQKTSSIMACQGRSDIERLHQRYHGRKISQHEIRKNTLTYLLKQILHDKLLRTRDFFRRSITLKEPK